MMVPKTDLIAEIQKYQKVKLARGLTEKQESKLQEMLAKVQQQQTDGAVDPPKIHADHPKPEDSPIPLDFGNGGIETELENIWAKIIEESEFITREIQATFIHQQ